MLPYLRSPISLEKIDQALVIAAYLVKTFGDEYLGVFQRLQSERVVFIQNATDRKNALELANKLSHFNS